MALLDADKIRDSQPKTVRVPVPEWGGPDAEVLVRGMSGTQRFAYEDHFEKFPDLDNRARLSGFTLCDLAGELLFPPDRIHELASKDAVALDRVFWAAVALNALSRKSVDTLEKNS